ncbi:hypothetical protein F3F96_06860 [Mariprofundus sp. NF]|nr:hypothetical protein [Mariprofundus sp. NF]
MNRKLHMRGISRLMVGLFAMQLFAAGFCLMIPQAHAMPMSMEVSHAAEMGAEHCAEPMQSADTDMQHTACNHCDQPDELWQNSKLSIDADNSFITLVYAELLSISVAQPALILTSLVPTGPPRSSSLIYTTTQRIRI